MPINAYNAYLEIFFENYNPRGVNALKQVTPADQYKADVAYWYGTLTNAGQQWKTDLLHRMWALIWHGGLWMRSGETGPWKAWAQSGMPMASCLSHGGRVLVQLTRDEHSEQVWKWFWGSQAPQPRHAATHGVKFGAFGDMPDGRPKAVAETKSGQSNTHFGVNMAGGGFGNKNPISGTLISDDGRHGHLYICYVAPSGDTRGALLFGAEDTAPIDRANVQTNQVVGGILGNTVLLPFSLLDLMTGGGWKRQPVTPGLRSLFPKGQTGAYHALGVSGDYSLTGGKKFKSLAKLHLDVPNGNDQLFVNPPADVWASILRNTLTFDKSDLGNLPPQRSARVVRVMPTVKQFYDATYVGRLHIRNTTLKQMDALLGQYHKTVSEGERYRLLDVFFDLGAEYCRTTTDPETVKVKVREYMNIADEVGD